MSNFIKKLAKIKKKESIKAGFVSFVLLSDVSADLNLLAENIREDWGIEIPSDDIRSDDAVAVTRISDMMVSVALMAGPIPNGEAVENAKTNFRWPEAVAVAENHKAHLLISVMRHEQSLLDAAVLFVKICSSCLKQPNATGINTLGSVLAPDFYINIANAFIKENSFPIMNLVFFGIYSNDEGKTISAYTYGLEDFGKRNIEILNSSQSFEEIQELIIDLSSYVIEQDAVLEHGQTCGFTAEQKLPITESD
ncbi:MAG: DUF4261 domain-containing protein [Syntrophorhabdaceae bacterium]|nr:DUF4261 domain-containing protein [Syntrophorhabdaceae bacterium]